MPRRERGQLPKEQRMDKSNVSAVKDARAVLPDPANRLLAELDHHDFGVIAWQLRPFALKQGATLQEQGAVVDSVYFPLNGIVSLVTVMQSGDTVETAMIGREGGVGLFAGLGRWRAFARAMVQVPGMALCMPAAQFQEAVHRCEPIRNLVLQYKEALLSQVSRTAACTALHSLESRLARWLLQVTDRTDGTLTMITHDMMSQMLGARRTTVTLLAGKLQEGGLIQYRRGRISILDRPGLEAAACECYHAIRQRTEYVFRKPATSSELSIRAL
jgi:CRP-like cAMP-binding protein